MEDKELIIKAKNGDKEAIEKIIIQYEQMIRKKSKGYYLPRSRSRRFIARGQNRSI